MTTVGSWRTATNERDLLRAKRRDLRASRTRTLSMIATSRAMRHLATRPGDVIREDLILATSQRSIELVDEMLRIVEDWLAEIEGTPSATPTITRNGAQP